MILRDPKNLREVAALKYVCNNPLMSVTDVADILDEVGLLIWISILEAGDPSHYKYLEITDA